MAEISSSGNHPVSPGVPVPPPGSPDAAPPEIPAAHRPRRRWLWLGLVVLFMAGAAIAMLVYLGVNLGIQALLIGLAAAILPVPVLVACFLWLDRYEPEPALALAACFVWGAFIATGVALIVNTQAASLFERHHIPDGVVAVVVAPFVEESMKALGPLILLWFFRRQISGITDGIVYCGLSATGFAMTENILYLGGHGYAAGAREFGVNTGLQLLFATFLVRVIFSAFAHPLFTAMTGVGIGIAARSSNRSARVLAPIAGLLVAMMLHGTWNFVPTIAAATGRAILVLYGYFALEMPIFLAMVGFALWLRAHEGRITVRALPVYVTAGWLTPPEVAALASLTRRHAARTWAKRVAGDAGRKAMRAFQYDATRLALVRDGMDRGLNFTPDQLARAQQEEGALLREIATAREVFVGRDPQTPRARWTGSAYELAFPDGVVRTVSPPPEPVVPIPVPLPPRPPAWGFRPAWPAPPPMPGVPPPPHGWPTPRA
jgi:RsiW-degrading membrane proteinase PrsW (M82 family)